VKEVAGDQIGESGFGNIRRPATLKRRSGMEDAKRYKRNSWRKYRLAAAKGCENRNLKMKLWLNKRKQQLV